MKINNNSKMLPIKPINSTEQKTLAKEKSNVPKDEFINETNLHLFYAFHEQSFTKTDLLIDISCHAEEKTTLPWWTEELEALLPKLPVTNNSGIASINLLNTLKTIANDKTYLTVNLCEEFNK